MLLIVFGAAVLPPVSGYEAKTVKVQPVESYPARTQLGGVTIAVDPYDTNEKSFSAFDIKNLNSRGYYPVHVIIRNSSQDFLTIHTRNILLITSSGQHLYTTPSSILVDDLNQSSALADFAEKELTNRLLDPDSVVDGFLFFFTPERKKNFFEGSTLYIPKLEEEGTRKPLGPFAIPLAPALEQSRR